MALRAARIVSPTNSRRLRLRTAARTGVESVRWLLAASFDQAALMQALQHDLEQILITPSGKQAGPELTQYREVEARIAKLQAEGVLQVDPAAHRLGRLPVGQVLEEVKDG